MIIAAKPVYLLAGQGLRRSGRDPMLAQILGATGVPQPRAAYLGSASGDNKPFYLMMAALLRAAGCGPVTLAPTVGRKAERGQALEVLQSADLIFVSGGDVEQGMRVLVERELIKPLRALYDEGRVFCGVSAGSIMLAREWVRWDDPHNDRSASLFACLGLADILCDTHGEGDGWEELQTALRLSPPGTIGYGIRSGAGLAWQPDGRVDIIGGAVDAYQNSAGTVSLMGVEP